MSDNIPPLEARPAALGPPRFSLRGLLAAMTLLGCLFGLMTAVGSGWSLVVLLFAGLAAAHVLGNSLGTRLRDGATLAGRAPVAPGPRGGSPAVAMVPGRLTQRVRLSRTTTLLTAAGSTAGAYLGGMGSAALYPEAGPAAVALGVVSAAVLGGFAGFLASSFLSVARQAWREALAQGDSPSEVRP